MNKAILFIAIMVLGCSAFAQETKTESGGSEVAAKQKGMIFFQGTWAELLKESKKTGKPIFLDAYAAWCGPCRMMAANTFPDEEVGNFFNQNFINYKLDMEKGEGPELQMKYRVTHYPTYLFLDASGTIKHRVMGYMIPDTFIREGKKAVESFKTSN